MRPSRRRLLARERPDVVGLQEVALWEKAPGTVRSPTAPFASTFDFLDLLLDALAERGVPYQEVATNHNFSGSCNDVAFRTLLDAGLVEVWPAVHQRDPCGGWTSGQDADLLNAESHAGAVATLKTLRP